MSDIVSSPPSERGVSWRRLLAWAGAAGVVTLLLWLVRDSVDKAHMALGFLVLVLVGSARDGRIVGLVLSVVCFFTFNFFLLPPFYTLRLQQNLDWWVLVAFVVTGGVAAELLHRQRVAIAVAERRAGEVDRLAALGAESLSVPRAPDAVEAIVRVIRTELPIQDARVRLSDAGGGPGGAVSPRGGVASLEEVVARERRIAALTREGTTHVESPGVRLATVLPGAHEYTDVLVPLHVRERTFGVLWLTDPDGLRFEPSQASFAEALVHYAALAAERVHLSVEAERVAALREAQRLKDALLASVSHDLRTPLTTIHAAASELRLQGDERGALIEEEADRLNRLVADLLDLSRLRAGALPLSLEINAAEDLVGAALQRTSGISGASDVRVALPPDGELALGRFDFVHSLRALTNLLENALLHSPEPGSVELEVRTDGADLVLGVRDRGPGVAPEDRPHVFEPFYRSASAPARGAGLGLAIASQVAEAQGGSVTYRPRPGGGSIFTLRLPAATLEAIT